MLIIFHNLDSSIVFICVCSFYFKPCVDFRIGNASSVSQLFIRVAAVTDFTVYHGIKMPGYHNAGSCLLPVSPLHAQNLSGAPLTEPERRDRLKL